MKVLITGITGQVGRALLASAPADVEVVPCSRVDLDLSDGPAIGRTIRRHDPEVIINPAAFTAVDQAESEPELAKLINATGPLHLARAAGEVGARLIHLSTDFVFDGTSSVPYRPDSSTSPVSIYGRTKRDGEEAVLSVLPGRSLILRTAWVYAAQGRNFMSTMLRLFREQRAVRVVADQVGTPTAASSIAHAIWKMVQGPRLGGVHHFTDAGVASWYDFAVAIAEEGTRLGLLPEDISVTPIATADYPTAARRPSYSVLDGRSLASLAIPAVHWRARLREVLAEIKHA